MTGSDAGWDAPLPVSPNPLPSKVLLLYSLLP